MLIRCERLHELYARITRILNLMGDIILKEESYKIIGICMEVHRELGCGFKEIIYKDALELEFANHKISYQREKLFKIEYKGMGLNISMRRTLSYSARLYWRLRQHLFWLIAS